MIQHILNQPSAKLFSMVQGTPALYNPFRRLSVTIKKPGLPYCQSRFSLSSDYFSPLNNSRIRDFRLNCVLSTFARREGINKSLYFALVILNFILSRLPEISTPARKGKGDFKIEI